MNNNFTEENIKKIKAWKSYIDEGKYGDSRDIINTYNQVFFNIKRPQQYTNCGSCLRRCVREMYAEYQEYEKDLQKIQELETKLQALETIDEILTPTPEEMVETEQNEKMVETEQKKRGRPRKNN